MANAGGGREPRRMAAAPKGRCCRAGLQRHHVTAAPTAAAPVALAQLPALVAGFTGRERGWLYHHAARSGRESGAVVVSAVAGLAGVRNALAVHAVHAARQAGWLPGWSAVHRSARL